MPSIVTLTLNPAIDKSAAVAHIAPEIKLNCHDVRHDPGGGGINVARAIKRLGGDALALFPSGGLTGQLLEQLLAAEDIAQQPLAVSGLTRENFTALDESTDVQFRFGMPGAPLNTAEQNACLQAIRDLDPAPDYLVASGSLPPDVPQDFYIQVIATARDIGAKLVLDTSGPPLQAAIQAGGVYLAKPNMRELQVMAGHEVEDETQLQAVARHLVVAGQVEVLVVSLGAGGAWLVTADHVAHIRAPLVPIQSKVGAGDSMVGGIVYSLAQGRDVVEAARFGVATGAAAVMTPGTQLCRAEDVQRLYAQMQSEQPSA